MIRCRGEMVDALEHGAIGSKSSYGRAGSIPAGSNLYAGIAQSVEQAICNRQVGGSSPSTSSRQAEHQPVRHT